RLYEPTMKFEVQVPEEFLGDVIGDLNSRRSEISDIEARGLTRVLFGKVPVGEIFGYSTTLRSLTQGRGTAAMEPDEYQPLPGSNRGKGREEGQKQVEERKKAQVAPPGAARPGTAGAAGARAAAAAPSGTSPAHRAARSRASPARPSRIPPAAAA